MTTPQTDAPTLQEQLRNRPADNECNDIFCDAAADTLDAHEATIAALVEALDGIDRKLTNMQPIIANGLLNELQLGYVDRYVDPSIEEARAALAKAAALK